MAGLSIGRAANDAFFIKEAGASHLPKVYIINALFLAFTSFFYSFLEKRIPRFFFLFCIISVFVIILYYLGKQTENSYWWLPYAIFSYYEVFLLLIQIHFWTCLNDIFGPREGKSIFPYIGGAGLAGTIGGGLFTWKAVSLIGLEGLFYTWFFLLLVSLPVALYLVRLDKNSDRREREGSHREFQNLRKVWGVSLVRYLALISIPLWIVVHSVDWLFYLAIEDMFKEESDRLPAFLGLLGSFVSLIGFLFQSFFTTTLLKRIGVAFSYSFYSISVSIASLLLALRGFFPLVSGGGMNLFSLRSVAAIMSRFLDESILTSIYDTALQLLYGALPASMRGQARALIQGIMEPAMTILTGLLLFVAAYYSVSHSIIAWFAFGCSVIWIILSFRMKKHYLYALAYNLGSYDLAQRRYAINQLARSNYDESTSQVLLESVLHKDTGVALLSLKYLKESANLKTLRGIPEILHQTKGVVFEMALEVISERRIQEALPVLKEVYRSSTSERKASSLRCMGLLDFQELRPLLLRSLGSPDPFIRGASVISLLSSQSVFKKDNPAYRALKQMVLSDYPQMKSEAVNIISQLRSTKLSHLILDILNDNDPEIKIHTIEAMGNIRDRKIVIALTEYLEDPFVFHSAIRSLIQIGSTAIPVIHKKVNNLVEKNGQSFIIEELLYCLGEIGDTKSLGILGGFFTSHKSYFRNSSIEAIIKIKEKNFELPKNKKNLKNLKNQKDRKDRKKTKKKQKSLESSISPLIIRRIRKSFYVELKSFKKIKKYLALFEKNRSSREDDWIYEALQGADTYCLNMLFKYMKVLSDSIRVSAASAGVQSNNKRLYSEAIEVLEGLGREGKSLAIFLETPFPSVPTTEIHLEKVLGDLININVFPWLNVLMIYLAGKMNLKSLAGNIQFYSNHPDRLLASNADEALKKLGGVGLNEEKFKEVKEMNKEMNTDMERILFLRGVPLFSDIEGRDLAWVNDITYQKSCTQGECIFSESEWGTELYIVYSGQVYIRKGRKELAILGVGECFGEMAILDSEQRSASAYAGEETELLAIRRNDFHHLLMARPRIAVSMFSAVSRRLREVTKQIQ